LSKTGCPAGQRLPSPTCRGSRAILWRDTGCDPVEGKTLDAGRPARLCGDEPFRKAVNTPVLHAAFDQLVGSGRWHPRADLGSFPAALPNADDPGDTGGTST